MADFKIPRKRAEEGNVGGSKLLPEGIWEGTLEAVRVQSVHKNDDGGPVFALQGKGKVFMATEAEIGSIQIGSIVPTDDTQADVGNMKFFDDLLVLSADGRGWDSAAQDGELWRLDQARQRLSNLALALGEVEEFTEDGEEYITPVSDFDGELRATAASENGSPSTGFGGAKIRFEVSHRTYKTRQGEDRTSVDLTRYIAL